MATSPPFLRWGVVGSGLICGEFFTAMRGCPSSKITAISSRGGRESVEWLLALLPAHARSAVTVYTSAEELAADETVDIVYVATGTSSHFSVAMSVLGAAHANTKAILVEKPLCWTVAQAKQLFGEAESRRIPCVEGMWFRHFPITQRALDHVKKRRLGEVVKVEAGFGWDGGDNLTHLTDTSKGNGALSVVGCYALHLAAVIFGPAITTCPLEVVSSRRGPGGAEAHARVCFHVDDVRKAVVWCSVDLAEACEAVITCEKGQVTLHAPFLAPIKATVAPAAVPEPHDAPEVWEMPLPNIPDGKFSLPHSEGLAYEIKATAALARCSQTGRTVIPAQEEVLCVLTLMERVRDALSQDLQSKA